MKRSSDLNQELKEADEYFAKETKRIQSYAKNSLEHKQKKKTNTKKTTLVMSWLLIALTVGGALYAAVIAVLGVG